MPTKYKINGVSDEEFQALFDKYVKTGEGKEELMRAYEKVSSFSSGCGACIIARAKFNRGLEEVREGDVVEGLTNVTSSLKDALSINIKKLTDRWL